MTEDIKNCPFCGSHIVTIRRNSEHACWIRCAKCYAHANSGRTREDAIDNWNQRNYDHFFRSVTLPVEIESDDDKKFWEKNSA